MSDFSLNFLSSVSGGLVNKLMKKNVRSSYLLILIQLLVGVQTNSAFFFSQ